MSEVAGPRSLHELLNAVLTIGSDLDLPAMRRRIVESATGLVDARYGALDVLDGARTRLAQFITVRHCVRAVRNGVTYVVTGGAAGTRRTGEEDFTAASFSWNHFVELAVSRDRLVVRAVNQDLRVADEAVVTP